MKGRFIKTAVFAVIGVIAAAAFIFLGISTFLGSRIDNFGKLSGFVEMIEEPELSEWDENAEAVITVSFSDVVTRINTGIYGADLADGMELLAPKEALTIQKLSALRLGGEDFSRFDMNDFSLADGDGNKAVIPAFGETVAWFDETGTDVIVQINMLSAFCRDAGCTSSPKIAVDYLKRLKEQYGVSVKYVSLDNEPMNWRDAHGGYAESGCTCEEYCELFSQYAAAIKAYDSEIEILGLDGTEDNEWNTAFLSFCAGYEKNNGVRILDMLSLHPCFESGREAKRYIEKITAQIDESYPGTALAFGEYKVEPSGDDATKQALELACVLGKMAEGNVSLACYSTLLDSEKNAMIDNGGVVFDGVCYGEKRPCFYTFHMMSNFVKGSLSMCSCSEDDVDVYAVRDGDIRRIAMINTAEESKKCSFSADDERLDMQSFLLPARAITVLEVNNNKVYAYICKTDEPQK